MSRRYVAAQLTLGVDPLRVPGAPSTATATATGPTAVSIALGAPYSAGGSAVTSYSAVQPVSGASVLSSASSPITVTGLTKNTTYTFQTWANNTYGPGATLDTNSVTTPSATYLFGMLASSTAGDDRGYGIAVDSSGNFYVAGKSTPSTNDDLIIAKYNDSGVIQWQRQIDSGGYEDGYAVTVDSSGNVYVAGYINASVWSIYIVKYNSAGTLQWQTGLSNGSFNGVARGITIDSSGNLYVAAEDNSLSGVVYVFKLNSSGTIVWTTRLTVAGYLTATCKAVSIDSSANVYVGGTVNLDGTTFYNYVAKLNSSGTLQWQRYLGTTGSSSQTFGVVADSSGNVYGAGVTLATSGNLVIYKYDTSGTLQWQRTLTAANTEQAFCVTLDSSNNVYVGGFGGTAPQVGLIVKYNSSGALQWQRSLTTATSNTAIYGIAADSSGNVYFTGLTNLGGNNILFGVVPGDGSKTGTYTVGGSSFVYAATTYTDAAGSLVSQTTAFTAAAPTFTNSAQSGTSSTSTLTNSVTTI